MATFLQLVPHAPLAAWVEHIWYWEGEALPEEVEKGPAIRRHGPDAAPHLTC
jgi:hypothetical protein